MPGFFYFVPLPVECVVVKKRLDRDVLRRFGLHQVLADVVDVPDDCVVTAANMAAEAGASIAGSMLVPKSTAGSEPLEWTYNPVNQTWTAHPLQASPGVESDLPPAGGSLWVGYETARPPRPEDLERKTQIGGAVISDKLDQVWRIPVARSPRGRSQLPAEYVRGPAGVQRRIDASYLSLWDLSGQVRDWIHGQLDLPTDRETWVYDAALQVLQTNYRLGVIEANTLQQLGRGVLTTSTVEPILVACVDWDLPQRLVEALEKKTQTPADN